MEISEKLSNADYFAYVDERGIGLENVHGDPMFVIYNLHELNLVFNFSNEQIKQYFQMRDIVRSAILNNKSNLL